MKEVEIIGILLPCCQLLYILSECRDQFGSYFRAHVDEQTFKKSMSLYIIRCEDYDRHFT